MRFRDGCYLGQGGWKDREEGKTVATRSWSKDDKDEDSEVWRERLKEA